MHLAMPRRRRSRFLSVLVAAVVGLLPVLSGAALAPSAGAASQGEVAFVDAASTAGNRTSHTVRIPNSVQAGDTLVLFLTTNSTTSTVQNAVTGWRLLESRDGNGTRGRAWTRTATESDAGSNVTVTTDALAKSVLSVAAYRSSGDTPTVSASASTAVDTAATSHTTPSAPVADANSWLVNVWSEKSSVTPTWTVPDTTVARTNTTGTGAGKVSAILADSAGAVPTGTATGRTATTSESVGRSVLFSVVINPGVVPAPTNQAPTAAFTSSCNGLACNFDASGSTDPENDPLTYTWDFGDGETGTGASPTHTYKTGGTHTVTLTLNDGTSTDKATHDVNPTAPQGEVAFVDAASTAGNRTSHTVRIPNSVQAGDTLVLFLTTNSTTSTVQNAVTGWRLLESRDGNGTRGRAWTRTATESDAGSNVTVTTDALAKSVLSVAAYRSSGDTPTVSASASTAVDTAATSHTTPSAPVADANSWLVNVWSEKSSVTPTWTVPDTTVARTNTTGTGAGKVSAILADSAGAVPTGTATGRTATTSESVGRSVLFSVVINPGVVPAPTNQAPTAAFTSSCNGLACNFDASGSTDPENDPLTYTWDFGDGETGTGASPTHTYKTGGTHTVTLTLNDGTSTDKATHDVNGSAPQPLPGHHRLVPKLPKLQQPKISDGEIWDIEVVGNRVYVVGTFTSIQNQTSTNTTRISQPTLAAYNYETGLIDTSFRPVFGGGVVNAVEASPDGTRLYIAGDFNSVNGVTRKGIAQINPNTGAPVAAFTANTDVKATELAVSDTTVYAGGRFTKVNNLPRRTLVAVDATTGAVDPDFVNDITGGLGTNGELTVQRLKLTHDNGRLLVVHTGRQVNGHDRYGVALIDTKTKQLLPWRTRIYQDNLQFVGGIVRAYAADISPDDSYFVVTNGTGGDRPPINDTVIAFPMEGGNDVQAKWISRHFDSVYSAAISEEAVYVGGHFAWEESPTAPDPWPGLDDVGYGSGQGLSGYGLGDSVVRREHVGALNPVDGKALEWSPGSNSFEGNRVMELTPRGLFTAGDGNTQGGYNVGRVAFYDFNNEPSSNGVETKITEPIEGRVVTTGVEFMVKGTASATSGGVRSVAVEVLDRESQKYLQDDLKTWGSWNSVNANLDSPNAASTNWTLPLTITPNRSMQLLAKAVSTTGKSDPSKDTKKVETWSLTDQTPTASVTGPTASPVRSRTFVITGTAADDKGVQSLSMTLMDPNNLYVQDDGTAAPLHHSIRITPDVVGATSTTWSKEVTVPHEGPWLAAVTPVDTSGQSSPDTFDRSWIVTESGTAPSVSINTPATMVPPTASQPVVVAPGAPLTFSGSANDDGQITSVEISLRNNTTREQLASDGTWGTDVTAGWYRVSPVNLNSNSYSWRYTTPFDLKPGSYSFAVRATDSLGLVTASADQGKLTVNAQVPGDAPPNGLLNVTGTITGGQVLHLDLTGTATDDKGVAQVLVALKEQDSSRYLQPDGKLGVAYAALPASLATENATSTTWSLPVDLPTAGNWAVTAYAYDTAGQQDLSTSGATATYRIYPGDAPPVITESLLAPSEGTQFDDGRIFISGRAEDDQAMQRVEVAVVDSSGRYMSSTGTFPNTTPSWRTAFITSPGTPGSNFMFTTPVVPEGAYKVLVRGVDQNDQVTAVPSERNVSVTIPPGNVAPTAAFTTSCAENVCTFDGRGSTDENATTLTYSWNFGNGTGTGPVPSRTYTKAGSYTVTLTVTDEWGATNTTSQTMEIAEPAGNVAPNPVINPPACTGLACNLSGVGSADPNAGDTITYRWDFGDGRPTSTSSAPSHTFPAAGTYTVTLTVTDGWGKANSTTREITFAEPADNVAPNPVITAPTCTGLACSFSGAGSADPNPGDTFTYRWDFGDGRPTSTSSAPSHTFPAAGTYTVTLTLTDWWGKANSTTREVTVTSP